MSSDTATPIRTPYTGKTLVAEFLMYLGTPAFGAALLAWVDISGFWSWVGLANLLLWAGLCMFTHSEIVEGEREQGFQHRMAAIDFSLQWRFGWGFGFFWFLYLLFTGFIFSLWS